MKRWFLIVTAAVSIGVVFSLNCQEQMVGAPCIAETDEGYFDSTLGGITYSIETRSVQCQTRVCLTQTEKLETTSETLQAKYSFCSCRCKDLDGHTYADNPDKYDDLCECPPNTLCEQVLGNIKEAPDKVKGSYCIPSCITSGCPTEAEICVPSSDSEKPWDWSCGPREDLQ